ncbi:DUF7507 domain-containing protein [Amedibacillus sp. YH-ame6]
MPFSYANPTSGVSAGGIGWFDFGPLTIAPGQTITNLSATLTTGDSVTFDLTNSNSSGNPTSYNTKTVPTWSFAYFSNASLPAPNYAGIAGNVALQNIAVSGFGAQSIVLTNIVVKDSAGNPISDYEVIVADAESTNGGPPSPGSETWTWSTNGGTWQQVAVLGNPSSVTTSGAGTQTFSIVGSSLNNPVASYVMRSHAPTSITLTESNLGGSLQAIAIGFAVTRITLEKNIGQRIDASDQFVLDINGLPASQATTTGSLNGIQTEKAIVYTQLGNSYTINEAMAAGSASSLSQYTQMVSASNATPAGSIPSSGSLPITFTPVLGDDVTYTILNAAPEVFVKTVDKAFANIGDVLTYTVRVDNPNNFPVNNILVKDATPFGTTYIGNIIASTSYSGTDLATGITLSTIPAASFATISWQVQVNSLPPIGNPIPNIANVDVPGGTSGVSNIVTTQVNTAFITMSKAVDKLFAKTGDIITYSILLTNAGNVPANNVVVTDIIPAGTSFVPGSLLGATGTPPTLNLIGSIAAGGTATISFKVIVGNTVPVPNPITNHAFANYTFTVDPAQPNGASSSASSNTVSTQISEAILSMEKTSDKSFLDTGDIITYTIIINNTGNVDANNVVVNDAVPSGTTFVPGSLVGATGTPPTLTLTNPIAAGASTTISFQVQVGTTIPSVNPIQNVATSTFTFTLDPEFPNGQSGTSASNTVEAQVNHASITTLKIVDKSYADTGDVITYTLQLQNTGNVVANNVLIQDVLPVGTTFLSGSLNGATGTPPILALINPLGAGASTTVSFQVKVDASVPQTNPLVNSATTSFNYAVNPANPDGSSGTEESNMVTTLINHAQINATKTVDKAYADVNDILTYTIDLQNIGNVAASNVTLQDAIPTGTTYVAGSLIGATGTLPNITLNTPIGAGGSSFVSFQVKVSDVPKTNPIQNIANVQYKYTVDPAQPNGVSATTTSSIVSTQVHHANVVIEKSADKFISFLGDTITYQISVTNTGNVPANNVVIKDIIVHGTNYVNGTLSVNVPYSGTPTTGITLTNPIAPGEVVAIIFKALIHVMPLPNPIVNIASVDYTYTVDTENVNGVRVSKTSNSFDTLVLRYNYQQQINDLIESVALQQAALAAIANAEGAKIQKAVAMGDISAQELLCINKSVSDMLASISLLEAVLKQKLSVVDCQIEGIC